MEKARTYLKPLAYTIGGSALAYVMYAFYKRFIKKSISSMWGKKGPIPLQKNVAMKRASLIENLKYNLFLQLKEFPIYHLKKTYDGAISINFDMTSVEDVFLDFSGHVLKVILNSKEISIDFRNNQLHLPKKYLKNQSNELYIRFENTYSNGSNGIMYYLDPEDTVSLILFIKII
jgi:hypothetical protein